MKLGGDGVVKILEIKNLTKSFQDESSSLVVLDHLSLDVNKGEFIAILGSSGCGKSTLLHLIAGIDKPDEGKIIVNQKDITKYNDNELAKYRSREVSLIYQFYNLIPILNVIDNIIFPLKISNQEIDKESLDNLLKELNLKEKENSFPSQLSGGQQQRVAIARAIMSNPQLILADEPTGNLDQTNSEQVMNKFIELHKQNHISIIMVTHELALAKKADRILVLENGALHSYEDEEISISM